jgi:hypothetical protein
MGVRDLIGLRHAAKRKGLHVSLQDTRNIAGSRRHAAKRRAWLGKLKSRLLRAKSRCRSILRSDTEQFRGHHAHTEF